MTKATTTRPNRLDHVTRDRGYRFGDRDPDLEWIVNEITRSGLSISDLIERVLDVSSDSVWIGHSTIARWLDGTTRRPQNHTLTWVARALGYERTLARVPSRRHQ